MSVLEEWITAVAGELGLADDVLDRDLVLDLARDVAHRVARPAAPLTTYLVGLAAGRAGGSAAERDQAARRAAAQVSVLAASWKPASWRSPEAAGD